MKLNIVFFLLGAGLTACSFGKHTFVQVNPPIQLTADYSNSSSVDSIVSPYKVALDQEMNQLVAVAEVDFINQRPNGNLGFLVADILLERGKKELGEANVICLLNTGGLRAPISKGKVTLGDVFKLMPFDNQLLLVKMPAQAIDDIQQYLKQSGGEPISGFSIQEGIIRTAEQTEWKRTDFWVVTSDYLMNGGDNMQFFQQKLAVINPTILLRDALIEGIKNRKVLGAKNEIRIKF